MKDWANSSIFLINATHPGCETPSTNTEAILNVTQTEPDRTLQAYDFGDMRAKQTLYNNYNRQNKKHNGIVHQFFIKIV